MRRFGLTAVVAIAVLTLVIGSVPAGSTTPTPGPPTAVHATSVAGVRGVTVSWSAPVSDGGAPIRYYVASTYTGDHFCVSFHSGPGACHIAGLKVGPTKPSIRVRAVSANGRGTVVVARVTHADLDAAATSSTPSAAGPTAVSQTAPAATSPSTSTGATAPDAGGLAKLPFSGADVEALLILGVILVTGGLLLLIPPGRRRSAQGRTADWLLQP
jgi:hypothetical protein